MEHGHGMAYQILHKRLDKLSLIFTSSSMEVYQAGGATIHFESAIMQPIAELDSVEVNYWVQSQLCDNTVS